MVGMPTVYLFRLAELRAGPRSQLRQQHPDSQGAFVDCAVPAQSLDEAKALLHETLADDDYTLVRFDEVIELGSEAAWRFPDLPSEYLEMGRSAIDSNQPVYGAFRCW